MKKKYLMVMMFITAANICFADNGSDGKTIAKVRVFGIMNNFKHIGSVNAKIGTVANPNPNNLAATQQDYTTSTRTTIPTNLGFEASTTYFLSDNIAVELGAGFLGTKFKLAGTFNEKDNMTTGYGGNYALSTQIKLVPINLTIQCHMAPYGKLSPYLGGGYNYTLASATSGSTITNGISPVIQGGFDAWVGNDLVVNVDVKKSFTSHKLTFNILQITAH